MKRKLAAVMFLMNFISCAFGMISVDVYLADCNTLLKFEPNFPHIYSDIMIGTKLEIYISSDTIRHWSGSLALVDANMTYGVLSARDFNTTTHDWAGSRFPAAGKEAVVWNWEESPAIYGFDMYAGSTQIKPGKWFVIDYVPAKVEMCKIGFYDHDIDWYVPKYYITFYQVRSRDFNDNHRVDFTDFAILSLHWLAADCNEPNWCQGTDLDLDHDVDGTDLSLFIDFWLRGSK